MIPVSLRMKNFLSYRNETPTFDFTAIHIACLSGDNGAGKSSFLEAIHWAIWGEARLGEREIITLGEQDMYVELTFMVNDINYRIHRSFTTNRGGTKLLLEQANDAQRTKWASISGGTMRETQQRITNEIVGMSYAVFQNSAYLRQGRADSFTQLTASERRDILAQILEIDQYEKYRERAKITRTKLNDEKTNLQGQMANDEQRASEIPTLEEYLNKADTRVQSAETYGDYVDARIALQNAQKNLSQTQQQYDNVTTLQQDLALTIGQLEGQLAQRPTIETQYQQLLDLEQTTRTLTVQREQHDELQQQHQTNANFVSDAKQQLTHTIQRLSAEIQFLDAAITNLPNLVNEHAQLTAQIVSLQDVNAQITALKKQQQELRSTLTQAQSQLQQLTRIGLEIQNLDDRMTQLYERTQPWEMLNTQLATCEDAQKRHVAIQSELTLLQENNANLSAQRDSVKARGLELSEKQKSLTVDQPCPTCQTMMDDDHYSHAVAEFEQEIVLLRSQFSLFREQITHINRQIASLNEEKLACEQQTIQAGDIRRQLGGIEAQRNELDRVQIQLAQLHQQHDAFVGLELGTTISISQQQIIELEDALHTANNQHAARTFVQQRLVQLQSDISNLTAQQQRRDACRTEYEATQLLLDTNQFAANEQRAIVQIAAALATLNFDPNGLRAVQAQIDILSPIRSVYNQIAVSQANLDAANQRHQDTTHRLNELSATRDKSHADVIHHTERSQSLASRIGERNTAISTPQMRELADDEIRNCRDHRSQLQAKLTIAREAQNNLVTQQARLATIANEMNRYDILEKAFASKGIQAMLIRDYAIPALEKETNQILARMSDNQLYLNISTNTETQRGTTIETIDLRVSDASGTRPIEAYSGGEAFRISFALRIALSKLLVHRAGHRLETLIIDEGFGTQDAQGRERLVEAINSISDDFHTILVITHIQELRDLFPVQIAFKRTVAGSSWEVVA